MPLKQSTVYILLFIFLISCGRKHVPETTNSTKPDSATVKRTVVKKMAAPKIIAVNDKVAKKSVDGRLYYDLDGHRYWKNYNDGKYYLFNQSMYTNSAFKPH